MYKIGVFYSFSRLRLPLFSLNGENSSFLLFNLLVRLSFPLCFFCKRDIRALTYMLSRKSMYVVCNCKVLGKIKVFFCSTLLDKGFCIMLLDGFIAAT